MKRVSLTARGATISLARMMDRKLMPFGMHKGTRLSRLPLPYLVFLRRRLSHSTLRWAVACELNRRARERILK